MNYTVDFKKIYDGSPDMCISVDPRTAKIVSYNETLSKRLGYTDEEIMNMKVIDFYHPDYHEKVKENLISFAKTGKIMHSDFKLLKKNKEFIEVSLKFTPIKDDKGNILYSNAVWRDVTELKAMQRALEEKNRIIEEKNKHIIDSINYAERIQQAILPEQQYRESILPQSFVFFKPKDIVSGDFYWVHKKEEKSFFLVADCTGHGVPGAFMSMIGTALFNQVVIENNILEPSQILNHIRDGIIKALHQGEGKSQDGMDASFCMYCKSTNTIKFTGANNPLYIIRQKNSPLLDEKGKDTDIQPKLELGNHILYEIKGDRQPIGYYTEDQKSFTTHSFTIKKNDTVYLFSDGYPDQFGGTEGKKYFYKTFKKFLISINHLSMEEQKEALNQELISWMGQEEQVDDICIIGAKFQ